MTAIQPRPVSAAWSIAFDRPAQLKALVIGAAFIAVFWHQLDFIPPFGGLVYAWVHEMDWSHGPLIPLFSAYLVYLKWDEIKRSPVRATGVGLAVMILGLVIYLLAMMGRIAFAYAQPASMMLTLLGLVVYLCGLPMLRYAWLPWLYLFFAIPIPQRLYFAWTNPLRKLAAEIAAMVMGLFPGVESERVGSNLHFYYQGQLHQIGVADACSGMRSTVTLCAVGVAVAFMSERPWWQRLILVASCVPIATLCNFLRVTTTCWLTVFVDAKYAHGTYHTMLGLIVIMLAFGIFSGLAWVLDHLVVEAEEEEPEPAAQKD